MFQSDNKALKQSKKLNDSSQETYGNIDNNNRKFQSQTKLQAFNNYINPKNSSRD